MDTQQLEYFISVAEFLNFTKAAKKFFISQTAISQQIKSLEKNLGVILFYRNNRSVKLTPAGEIFYKEAKLIIAKTNDAIKKVQMVSAGFIGSLKVGFVSGHGKTYLPKLIRKFNNSYTSINLSIVEGNVESLYKSLKQGLLDVTFNLNFDLNEYKNIKWKSLKKYPLYVVLYKNHYFSKFNSIPRSYLKNEDFIYLNRFLVPKDFDRMISACVDSGFSPNIIHQCDSIQTILLMIEAEMGISIFPKYIESKENSNLTFIKLDGENEYVESVVAWNTLNINPSLAIFLQYLDEIDIFD